MDSTRPIRALMRGLDALTVLNQRDGATVSEVAHEIRLPRTTVYRILETLCGTRLIFRDPSDDRYRLTANVRGLRTGFHDESWIARIARPALFELGRDVVWPLSLATLSGNFMMTRETTDHATPLATERQSAGLRIPLVGSAAGRVYLAFCAPLECQGLLDQDKLLRNSRAEIERNLSDVKAQGHATMIRAQRLLEEISVSVPVMDDNRVLAALTVRFTASAVPQMTGLERFLPKLHDCAVKIGAGFLAQSQPGAVQ